MQIDMILFIGFGVFLVLLFLIIYFKDLESNRKFERYARSIEDLNRQVHKLGQNLAQKKEQDKLDIDEMKIDIHKRVQDEINTKVTPLLNSLKDVEAIIYSFKDDQQQRISNLEQKNKMNMPDMSIAIEKDVILAYQNGKTVHEIARDLRLGIGEVEFILKMHDLL